MSERMEAMAGHGSTGAFPKCEIFLADEEHHNLPLDETVPLARWRRLRC
jgi:hypothetical protein